ncbi:hypothetical protein E2C01_025160 [Portunus trituberculatus]|uniref:Uncharacterized protein n=1 Tax=Portunus trituberculatus TaxID=210409 RepID=A0A5B7EC89_PORTR|nr:hypothetical protein [Portunus trituberculatus]
MNEEQNEEQNAVTGDHDGEADATPEAAHDAEGESAVVDGLEEAAEGGVGEEAGAAVWPEEEQDPFAAPKEENLTETHIEDEAEVHLLIGEVSSAVHHCSDACVHKGGMGQGRPATSQQGHFRETDVRLGAVRSVSSTSTLPPSVPLAKPVFASTLTLSTTTESLFVLP